MSTKLPDKDDFLGWIALLTEKYGSAYLDGAKLTLLLALVGTFFGCLIGFICGIIQTIPVEKNDSILKKIVVRAAKIVISIYVEFFRGTPMMAQAGLIYYGITKYYYARFSPILAGFFIISINIPQGDSGEDQPLRGKQDGAGSGLPY